MRGAVRAGTVLALVGCALPGAASAGVWRAAEKLTDADRVTPQVAVLPSADAVVVWGSRTSSEIETVVGPAGATFGPATLIGRGAAVRLASSATGYTAAMWRAPSTGPTESRTRVAVRPPGGPFTTPVEVSGLCVAHAVDGDGDVTAIFFDSPPISHGEESYERLYAVTISSDGNPGPGRVIARQRAISLRGTSVAVDAAGTATVAWRGVVHGQNEWRTFVATAPPGGPFTTPEAISPPGGSGSHLRLASNARGDQLVVWNADAGAGEPTPTSVAEPAGAFRPAGGRFGPPERVLVPEGGTRDFWGGFDVAMSPDGAAVAAWSDGVSLSYSHRPASGPLEPAQAPAPYPVCCAERHPPLRTEPAVGFDGRGNAMVMYRVQEPDVRHVEAVMHPRGGTFGPPERVFTGEGSGIPDVALDAAGNAVAVWSPQEMGVHDPGRRDLGVYTSYYDANAAPSILRFALERTRRARLAFRATSTGRVSIAVDRRSGGRTRRVLRIRELALRGANRVRLTRRRARALSRPGRYRATISGRDQWGARMKPRRIWFGPLAAR